ncbi:tetratricopeptide repeat protein [Cytophagaceae bacterium ABcell3]|nr:tetratricopeptide repeat protein [Cytophagaceae bacterium ABcell3]
MLLKNALLSLSILSLNFTPEKSVAKVLYGEHTPLYNYKMQHILLSEAQNLRNDRTAALEIIHEALEYSRKNRDRSSTVYQDCMNELGYLLYLENKYQESEHALNAVIEAYENTESGDDDTYYDAIKYKAYINSNQGKYSVSDSLLYVLLERDYSNDSKLTAHYRWLGYNQKRRRNLQKADSLFKLALYHYEYVEENKKSKYELLWIQKGLAQSKLAAEDFSSADSLLQICKSYAKSAFGEEHIEYAKVADVLVNLHIQLGNYYEAEDYCLQSLRIKESLEHSEENILDSKIDLINIFLGLSKYKEAEELIREGLTTLLHLKLDNSSPTATMLYDMVSQFYEDKMDYEEALIYARKSVDGRTDWYGKYHIKTASSHHQLASVLYKLSQYKDSKDIYNLALGIKKRFRGQRSGTYASSLNGLSLNLIAEKDLSGAEDYLEFCLDVYEELKQQEHVDYATVLSSYAYLQSKFGNDNKAEELYKESLKIYKGKFKGAHLKLGHTYYALATLKKSSNNFSDALQYYKKAHEHYSNILGSYHHFANQIQKEIEALGTA